MDAATISSTTFWLRDATNAQVAATVTYDVNNRRAILTPNAFLHENMTYTTTLRGTNAGVKDVAGNPLANDFSWSFTTKAEPPPSVGDTTCREFFCWLI